MLFEQIDEMWSNFEHVLTVTGSRLVLLLVYFRKYTTQLWPLIIVKVLLSLNI